jgi:hypothetical protein
MTPNMAVTMKASPHPMAAILMRVLSTRILLEYFDGVPSSSEVRRSISAVAPSHMLRSVNVIGMFISITFAS